MDHELARIDRGKPGHILLNTRQAAHHLRLTPRLLERMRSRGDGPPFRRHARYVVYHVDDLESWSARSGSAGRP